MLQKSFFINTAKTSPLFRFTLLPVVFLKFNSDFLLIFLYKNSLLSILKTHILLKKLSVLFIAVYHLILSAYTIDEKNNLHIQPFNFLIF